MNRQKSLLTKYINIIKIWIIYIYTNVELRHTVTDEELNGEKDMLRIRIERKSKENGSYNTILTQIPVG